MRIMTTNIWGDYFENPVELRENDLLEVYKRYEPDIIGFQEVTGSWYNCKLFSALSDKYCFVGTEIRNNSNFVPLAYSKEYRLISKGFEYLENTPDVTKGVTWAVLLNEKTSKTFAVCNTHFFWMTGKTEYDDIRESNARQLSLIMHQLRERYKCPVFAFGDMNCRIDSSVFTDVYRDEKITHLFDLTYERDDVSSHHGDPVFDKEKDRYIGKSTTLDHTFSIDHIVAVGDEFSVSEYRVVTDAFALDATDHSPVYVDIDLK